MRGTPLKIYCAEKKGKKKRIQWIKFSKGEQKTTWFDLPPSVNRKFHYALYGEIMCFLGWNMCFFLVSQIGLVGNPEKPQKLHEIENVAMVEDVDPSKASPQCRQYRGRITSTFFHLFPFFFFYFFLFFVSSASYL